MARVDFPLPGSPLMMIKDPRFFDWSHTRGSHALIPYWSTSPLGPLPLSCICKSGRQRCSSTMTVEGSWSPEQPRNTLCLAGGEDDQLWQTCNKLSWVSWLFRTKVPLLAFSVSSCSAAASTIGWYTLNSWSTYIILCLCVCQKYYHTISFITPKYIIYDLFLQVRKNCTKLLRHIVTPINILVPRFY